MFTASRRLLLVVPLAAALAGPSPLTAQTPHDVTVHRMWSFELGGALGTMMRLMPGMDESWEEVTYIHGEEAIVRTDAKGSSTIINYETGEMIVEDHDDESFFRFAFSDAIDALPTALSAQQAEMDEAMADVEAQDADVEYEVSLKVERPGDTKVVNDVELTLVRMIVTAKPVKAKDVDPEQLPTNVLISDSWMAVEAPGADAFQRIAEAAMGQLMDSGARDAAGGLSQVFAMNNALSASYDELAEEMEGFEGFPYETVTVFVNLMPGVELDIEAAMTADLAGPDVDLGAIAREAAAEGAKDALKDAARSRMGRLGGMFGRRNEEPEEEEAEEEAAPTPTQIVVLRMFDRTGEVVIGPVEGAWTEPNPEYEEKENPFANLGALDRN